jgi:hypothetical protein
MCLSLPQSGRSQLQSSSAASCFALPEASTPAASWRWRSVRCAQLHAAVGGLSQRAAAYSSPRLEGPFLDAFWKHYKPQKLACSPSAALPARIRPTRDRACCSSPLLPRHRRRPPQALPQLEQGVSRACAIAPHPLYCYRCPPSLHADAAPRILAAPSPPSLHRSRSRRQRAALDPSPPPSQCPYLPTTPMR